MSTRLFVGNMPFSASADDLRALFEGDGRAVRDAVIVTDRETGRPRGFAFVEMETTADAEKAMAALNEADFGGRNIRVSMATPRTGSGGGSRGPRRDGGGRGGRDSGGNASVWDEEPGRRRRRD